MFVPLLVAVHSMWLLYGFVCCTSCVFFSLFCVFFFLFPFFALIIIFDCFHFVLFKGWLTCWPRVISPILVVFSLNYDMFTSCENRFDDWSVPIQLNLSDLAVFCAKYVRYNFYTNAAIYISVIWLTACDCSNKARKSYTQLKT